MDCKATLRLKRLLPRRDRGSGERHVGDIGYPEHVPGIGREVPVDQIGCFLIGL